MQTARRATFSEFYEVFKTSLPWLVPVLVLGAVVGWFQSRPSGEQGFQGVIQVAQMALPKKDPLATEPVVRVRMVDPAELRDLLRAKFGARAKRETYFVDVAKSRDESVLSVTIAVKAPSIEKADALLVEIRDFLRERYSQGLQSFRQELQQRRELAHGQLMALNKHRAVLIERMNKNASTTELLPILWASSELEKSLRETRLEVDLIDDQLRGSNSSDFEAIGAWETKASALAHPIAGALKGLLVAAVLAMFALGLRVILRARESAVRA